MTPQIEFDRSQLEKLARKYGVQRLSFFGSVVRDDFGETSDVDILVEFLPGSEVGFSFFSLQEELSKLVGRPVDLSTPGFLSPRIRERVASEAAQVYEAA
jgi:predicted nucleotidyltransferase